MSFNADVNDPCFGFIIKPAYNKAWQMANRKFSLFSLTVDDFNLVSKKGRWVVDGTIVNGDGTVYKWRVAVFRLSSDGGIGTAFRHMRRVSR